MVAKSPYGRSKHPARFSSFEELRAEIVERRRTLIPSKSHMNMAPKALQKVEEGSELRAPQLERYLALMGHRATVALRDGNGPIRELPLGKISEAAVLAVKASAMANRDVARALGKFRDYFSLKETRPSVEFALEIFRFLGYSVGLRLYSQGITDEMEQNLELKRRRLGLKGAGSSAPSARQSEAESALAELFLKED